MLTRSLLFLSVVALCAAARADEPAPQSLTLLGALTAAGNAPARHAAAARTEAAARAVDAAGAWPATVIGASTTAHTPRAVLTAALPLPIFGTLSASSGVAEAGFAVARAEEGTAGIELRRRVAGAWIELARAEAKATGAAEAAAAEDELARIAKARFAAGDTARADAVQAGAAAARGRSQAAAAKAAVTAASAVLAGELAWDPTVALHAEPGLGEPADVPELAALRERAGARPQARAAAARVELERAHASQARAERWPRLSVDLEADLDDPTLPGNDYRVGLAVELPLFGHTGDAVAAAEAQTRAALADRASEKSTADAQVVAAYRRFHAAAERARTLAREVLPAQREAAAMARTAYREGQGGLADVIIANRALGETQVELVDAYAEAGLARADLEQAVGGDL